jgi:hypothetical protein
MEYRKQEEYRYDRSRKKPDTVSNYNPTENPNTSSFRYRIMEYPPISVRSIPCIIPADTFRGGIGITVCAKVHAGGILPDIF